MEVGKKQAVVADLQQQILTWQGYKEIKKRTTHLGLGELERSFPGQVFPTGTIHEFMTSNLEEEAATTGFIGSLLAMLLQKSAVCLWISNNHSIFPVAMQNFGIAPDRIVFIRMQKEQDILWALEEGLKCSGLSAVIAEVNDLDFIASRRLQLAVEKSRVTGLVLRKESRVRMSTVCTVRWQIKPLPSKIVDALPGVGFPVWDVNILKIKNGSPSRWQIAWQNDQLLVQQTKLEQEAKVVLPERKIG